MDKVSSIIINTLSSGEKRRSIVTNKIKNYPKQERDAGIKSVLEKGYVTARYEKPGSPGRTAVVLKLTKKGKDAVKVAQGTINEKSVWSV